VKLGVAGLRKEGLVGVRDHDLPASELQDGQGRLGGRARALAEAGSVGQALRLFLGRRIHVQARLEDDAQCLLVIIGATPEGNKELVGLTDGVRENAQSWKGLLLDLKRRGLVVGPELAVADGALGFWQAIEEVWPKTRGQRCWVHKSQRAQ
jgi:hypothetical protein